MILDLHPFRSYSRPEILNIIPFRFFPFFDFRSYSPLYLISCKNSQSLEIIVVLGNFRPYSRDFRFYYGEMRTDVPGFFGLFQGFSVVLAPNSVVLDVIPLLLDLVIVIFEHF